MKLRPLRESKIFKEYKRQYDAGETKEQNFTRWWQEQGFADWYSAQKHYQEK